MTELSSDHLQADRCRCSFLYSRQPTERRSASGGTVSLLTWIPVCIRHLDAGLMTDLHGSVSAFADRVRNHSNHYSYPTYGGGSAA